MRVGCWMLDIVYWSLRMRSAKQGTGCWLTAILFNRMGGDARRANQGLNQREDVLHNLLYEGTQVNEMTLIIELHE